MKFRTLLLRILWASGLVAGGMLVTAIISAIEPDSSRSMLLPPSIDNWLGTDHSGRSGLSLALRAAHTTLVACLVAGCIAFALGVSVGMVQALRPSSSMAILLRNFTTLLDTVGPFLPTVALLAVFPRMPVTVLGATLGALTWPSVTGPFAFLLKKLLKEQYVIAAMAMGGGWIHLARVHLLEPISRTLVPLVMALSSGYLAIISSLQFLGAFSASEVSVGTLLYDGLARSSQAPWMLIAAVTSFLISMLAILWVKWIISILVRVMNVYQIFNS